MIETSRLRLRRCRMSDVDAVLAYRSREDVASYLSAGIWNRLHAVSEIARYAEASFAGPGDELVLLAETRDGNEVVGEVGLIWQTEPIATAEVGYVFNPDFGGCGLATEAVATVVTWALHTQRFERVRAVTDAANAPSRALCERVGLTLTATSLSTDGRNVEECIYTTGREARKFCSD